MAAEETKQTALGGKVALVTGATRGIGAAIAAELGRVGATVVGIATSTAGAERISAQLAEQKIAGRGAVLDVTDSAAVADLVAQTTADYGAPTVLVNNAGITRDTLLLRMSAEQWSEVIDTNLNAVYRLCRACLRGMTRARWGRIINIGSVVGGMGNAGQANYAASKAAVAGFSRSLAREVGGRGITVNTVAPGFIDTDMTRALDPPQREAMLAAIPAARFGEPQEVAALVAFLASNSAAYITGETIQLNGGMYMA
ncbi:MAG: 3-oxoacyl-ACP reductase FabG [Cellvibrionales bacterium]|nr:3-oxoacyl-ACP reductase FabG [Cellvibrionales bacterium]